MAENLVSIMKEKGYTYRYYTWNDGHSWANWRDHLGISLVQFFPSDKK
jgi:enterochelin esterase-like enzyme